jgi:hypothetical protein
MFAMISNCFCKCFRYTFQMFHQSFYLDVLKVDRLLYIPVRVMFGWRGPYVGAGDVGVVE